MSSNAVSMLRFAQVTTPPPRSRRAKSAAKKAPAAPASVVVPAIDEAAPVVPVRKRWPSARPRPAAAVLHG